MYFCFVGGCGFIVEAVVLQLMLSFGFGPIQARCVGFPLAVLTTWALHRRFTFAAGRSEKRLRELSRYLTAQSFSVALGFIIYAVLVLQLATFRTWPLLALIVSSIVGTVSNFLLSRFVVFTATPDTTDEQHH
ncbi:MAG: GtrA family protein [Pseudomonadota bacterium]